MYLLKYILVFVYCSVTGASEEIERFDLKVFVDGNPVTGDDADQNSSVHYNVGQTITFVCKVENSHVPYPADNMELVQKRDGSVTTMATSDEEYVATSKIIATAADNDSEVYCTGEIWDSYHYKFLTRESIVKKLIMNSDELSITPEERNKKISTLKEQYLQELRKIKNDSDENDLCNCSCVNSVKQIETSETLAENNDNTGIESTSVIATKDNESLNEDGNNLEADQDGHKFIDFITSSFQKLTESKKKKQLKLVNQKTTVEIREID